MDLTAKLPSKNCTVCPLREGGGRVRASAESRNTEPVDTLESATSIVPVVKCDKSSVRMFKDFRVTLNPISKVDATPFQYRRLIHITEGQDVYKLDLSQAYQQLPLDDALKKCVVINTHKRLFRYTIGSLWYPQFFRESLRIFCKDLPTPNSVTQLKSHLWLLAYYSKFLFNLLTTVRD